MRFNDIHGSVESKNILRGFVDEGKMPHALLISGTAGNSKLALALAYASYLMCENPHDGDACGNCRSCKKTMKYIHPDLHFSFPFVGKEISDVFITEWRSFLQELPYGNIRDWLQKIQAENKQANINVKECQSIIRKLNMQAFESPKKVIIMWLPEYLKKEGNRLLKIIEEPTDNTYFILVTEDISQILPTILSRCQHIHVPPFSDDEIVDILKEKFALESERARHISFIAEGDMRIAEGLISQEPQSLNESLLLWFRICYANKPDQLVEWVNNFAKQSKEEQRGFLEYVLNFLREIGRVRYFKADQLRIQENEIETAKKIAGILTFEKIEKLSKILTDTIYYIERNANIRILMLDTNLSFKNVLRK